MDKRQIIKQALITLVMVAAVSYASKQSIQIQEITESAPVTTDDMSFWDYIKRVFYIKIKGPGFD